MTKIKRNFIKIDYDLAKELVNIVGKNCSAYYLDVIIDLETITDTNQELYVLCTRDCGTRLYYQNSYCESDVFEKFDCNEENRYFLVEPFKDDYQRVTEIDRELARKTINQLQKGVI